MTSASRFQNPLPVNILRGIVPTATLWDGTIGYAFLDDGGVFADDTTDANSAAANDVPLMPAVPVLNDAFYFGEGFSASGPFNALKINLGTAGVGGTIAWEYYNGAAWVALTVTDATNGFTTAGAALYVTWTEPADWAAVAVNGQTRYWVRARVLTAFAPIPLATQMWLGRYPTSLANTTDGDITTVMGTGTMVKASAGYYGYITIDLGTPKLVMVAIRCGLWSSAGQALVYIVGSIDNISFQDVAGAVIATTSATELIADSLSKLVYGRYVRIGIFVSVAATANAKIYEVMAYELGT